jgi:type IV secretion system protein VirB10
MPETSTKQTFSALPTDKPKPHRSAWDTPIFPSDTGVGVGSTAGAAGSPHRVAVSTEDEELGGGEKRPGAGIGSGGDTYSQALHPSDLGGPAKAKVMPHAIYTIAEGEDIPCILKTAINSQLVGGVSCNIKDDVFGEKNRMILLPKGTRVVGQIRSGLRQGQNRLFVLWTSARTPDGVKIALNSPASDELGRAGIPGQVDDHFWQRFWAVTLFSAVEALPQVAASALQALNKQGGSGNSYVNYIPSAISPQQQLAGTILQEQIQIPPTLVANQGDVVGIYIARDLDFSDVYRLQLRTAAQ